MKKSLSVLLIAFTMIIISCKKEESPAVFSLDTASGIWSGRYNYGSGDGNPFSLILDKNGNSTFVDSSDGSTKYNGIYTVFGDSLACVVSKSSVVVNFRFKVNTDFNSLNGSWVNLTGSASGFVNCTKK
ncbi:MAG: hypothetical protein U0X41_01785 [Chitinophagales bacterium]